MAEISTIARPYAVAAYKLGREQKALGKWSEMLGFAAAVANDAQIKAYIQDPKVVSSDLQTTLCLNCKFNKIKEVCCEKHWANNRPLNNNATAHFMWTGKLPITYNLIKCLS